MLASRSLIYAELNRAEEAIADLVKLLDTPPDSTKAPAWLAARQRLFDELGQTPELFERITQLRPADASPWIGRARYHASRISLTQVAQMIPNRPTSRLPICGKRLAAVSETSISSAPTQSGSH